MYGKKKFPPTKKCHFGFFLFYRPQFLSLGGKSGCFCAYLGELFRPCGLRIKQYLQITKLEANKVRFLTETSQIGRAWVLLGGHGPLQKCLKRVHTCCTYMY